jgi:hypothetical protein
MDIIDRQFPHRVKNRVASFPHAPPDFWYNPQLSISIIPAFFDIGRLTACFGRCREAPGVRALQRRFRKVASLLAASIWRSQHMVGPCSCTAARPLGITAQPKSTRELNRLNRN